MWPYKCLPMCVDRNAACLLHPALERPEGVSQQDYAAMEEFQQRTNAVSLEKVKAYYRRLRYTKLGTATQCSCGLLTCTHFTLKRELTPWSCLGKQKGCFSCCFYCFRIVQGESCIIYLDLTGGFFMAMSVCL